MSDTLSLFVTAASPVLQAGLLAAAGAAMAWQGTLDARGSSTVAGMSFYLFTPALTFSTLASAISLDSIQRLWPLLANMLMSSVVGLGVGRLAAWALETPVHYINVVVVAVACGNVGNLPLVFVGALCEDPTGVFRQSLGDSCRRLGVAYTAFDICVATLFQFSLAIYLLRPPVGFNTSASSSLGVDDDDHLHSPKHRTAHHHQPTTTTRLEKNVEDVVEQVDVRSSFTTGVVSNDHGVRASAAARLLPQIEIEMEVAQMPPPGHRHPHMIHDDTDDDDGAVEIEYSDHHRHHLLGNASSNQSSGSSGARRGSSLLPIGAATLPLTTPPSTSSLRKINFLATSRAWLCSIDWRSAFPLPTQAAFLGVFVGCVAPLRGLLYGPAPLLRPLAEALELLSEGLIPTAIPLLGAVLYRGPGRSQLSRKIIGGTVVTRLVVQPALLTGIVVAALHFKLFTAPDPMFLLTMLLANATPTAINMQTITVLYKFGASEMSALLFFQYCSAMVTLPAWTWLFLRIIEVYV